MARGFLTTTAVNPDSNQENLFTATSTDFVVDLGASEAHQFETVPGSVEIEVLVVEAPAGGQPAAHYVALTVEQRGSRKVALVAWGRSINVGDKVRLRLF